MPFSDFVSEALLFTKSVKCDGRIAEAQSSLLNSLIKSKVEARLFFSGSRYLGEGGLSGLASQPNALMAAM